MNEWRRLLRERVVQLAMACFGVGLVLLLFNFRDITRQDAAFALFFLSLFSTYHEVTSAAAEVSGLVDETQHFLTLDLHSALRQGRVIEGMLRAPRGPGTSPSGPVASPSPEVSS